MRGLHCRLSCCVQHVCESMGENFSVCRMAARHVTCELNMRDALHFKFVSAHAGMPLMLPCPLPYTLSYSLLPCRLGQSLTQAACLTMPGSKA